MAGKTTEERLDRLETIVPLLAEGQLELEKLVGELATSTRKAFDQVAEQFAAADRRMTRIEEQTRETGEQLRQTSEQLLQTGEQMRQTGERMRQTDERMRQTDERIDKLVSTIGEFIRRGNQI